MAFDTAREELKTSLLSSRLRLGGITGSDKTGSRNKVGKGGNLKTRQYKRESACRAKKMRNVLKSSWTVLDGRSRTRKGVRDKEINSHEREPDVYL